MSTLIEQFCPSYLVRERHHTRILASRETILRVVRRLDFSASWLTRQLFRLRGLRVSSFDAAGLADIGLRELAVRDDEVLLGGYVGTNLRPVCGELDELRANRAPRLAVLAWNFHLWPVGDGSFELRTETRVHCERAWVAALFLPYWAVIRPFSGWIRRDMLRVLKTQAEREAHKSRSPAHA